MKTQLTLRRQIWNTLVRRESIKKALTVAAVEVEKVPKDQIDNSTPAGRIYERGSITVDKRSSKFNRQLRRKANTKTRAIAGTRFHRASAPGQPPARDTDELYKSIKARVELPLTVHIEISAPYATILENKMNRPFFKEPIRVYFKTKFRERVKSQIGGLLR